MLRDRLQLGVACTFSDRFLYHNVDLNPAEQGANGKTEPIIVSAAVSDSTEQALWGHHSLVLR
jgi:hypothetical protein